MAPASPARTARIVACASALLAAAAALMVLPEVFWLRVHSPHDRRQFVIGLLQALTAGYLVALASALAGGVVLGWWVIADRRRGRRRPLAGRLLLMCGASLVGFALAEIGAAAWLAWAHRLPPLPAVFPEPDDGRVSIVVIGGSSAWGVPFGQRASVGPVVARALNKALPGRRFQAEVLAEPGVPLERMHQKLEGLKRRPDVMIIYSGHNEYLARFSRRRYVAYYDDDRDSHARAALADRAAKVSPLVRMTREVLESFRVSDVPAIVSDAPGEAIQRPACSTLESAAVVAAFRNRLEAIVSDCERLGCLPVLVIPPGNEAGFEPSRTVALPKTTRPGARALSERLREARALEESEPSRADAEYRALLADQPTLAEAHYRLALHFESAGDLSEANRHYALARDGDGMPLRCTSALEQVYRDVARDHPRALLIDGPAVLRAASGRGVLDDHSFVDGVHPTLRSYVALGQAVLDGLRTRRAFGWPAGTPAPVLDPAEIGIDATAWACVCDGSAAYYWAMAPFRFDPAERRAKSLRYREAARRIRAGARPEDVGIPGIGLGTTERTMSPRAGPFGSSVRERGRRD